MLVLFDTFFYTDEYWEKIENGIKSEEDDVDYGKDCETRKTLVNIDRLNAVKPIDNYKYTQIYTGDVSFILKFPFKDFIKLVPYQTAKELNTKWAN